jgi:hypothetical protein
MVLDLAAPYSIRLHYLQSFLKLDGQNQHAVLRQWIALQFLAIYTKVRSTVTCLGLCTFLVLPSLPLASVVLFAKSDKDGYDKSNITVTYILFLGTVVMELAPFFFILIIGICLSPCNNLTNKLTHALRWQDMVAQHNIMSVCARKKKPPTLMKLATFSYLKHWYIWHKCVAQQISVLVRHHTEDHGWKKYIRDG